MTTNEEQKADRMIRGYVGISFAVVLIWQLYQLILMFKQTPLIMQSLSNLGAELPIITNLYLSIYNWFVILPVITIVLIIDMLRRKSIPKTCSIIAFGAVALLTLLMQMLFSQAMFAPFFLIIEKL
ncbi:MAG: hypothetical protein GY757_24325 [bacterium]|nr:hypothetical protein [bacterium]